MAGQNNAAPVIIKRKKKVIGGGHHGGAWKVAYADFVTAMMAFFMLMWLLNATTEQQRKGISDYFSPTIPLSRISGGGDGSFGGDSVLAEDTLAQNGTGASSNKPTDERQSRSESQAEARQAEEERLAEVQKSLLARSGESMTMERLLRHVVTRVTDEGLVIELFDLEQAPLFQPDSATATQTLRDLAVVLADVLLATRNDLAVGGYVRSYPLMMRDNPVWSLSADRAQAGRQLLRAQGVADTRFARITGFADRKPLTPDPSVIRNNRLEVILLRKNR
ncbi:MAG: flagellar motor protein MotB [Pseudotabrizicola sp.]|uniref:flagellar motor protein MotB n=1 Tax=Pseudotabrizicola sp. TaxID=2939647 RepID=UPI0027216C1D|nr:flagellar motor protein MotB [Pseudotabrizicola sp.]MDO8883657.1 flagellar motor protein MotB [Pseudotabrizicola sp.]MDP2081814.1 flagellar motor protein MotB [Pseudotabrizicola sp.]MDZ7573896.1 flagellar motor protein MotB [Pseudotabrizicola sp.]